LVGQSIPKGRVISAVGFPYTCWTMKTYTVKYTRRKRGLVALRNGTMGNERARKHEERGGRRRGWTGNRTSVLATESSVGRG
jgi:hypothetical protein